MRSVAFRVSGLFAAGIFGACVLSGGAGATTETQGTEGSHAHFQLAGAAIAIGAPDTAFDAFLDRLMRAESNGRNDAKNPLSSALGPFQFINSTFLAVMRRHFASDVAHMGEREILALRTDRGFARRAAAAFSKENMAYLAERGINPTFGHLRLAFLLGPSGAARVLQAPPSKPLAQILEGSVIAANPFMRSMSAADLVARATRDVSERHIASAKPLAPVAPAPAPQPAEPTQPAHVAEAASPMPTPQPAQAAPRVDAKAVAEADAKPRPTTAAVASAQRGTVRHSERVAVINVTCNSKLASCRRWIDQQVAKLART